MENAINLNDFEIDLTVSHEIEIYLKETAKWAKFLSIVGFMVVGIILLIALFAGSILTTIGSMGVSESISFGFVSV